MHDQLLAGTLQCCPSLLFLEVQAVELVQLLLCLLWQFFSAFVSSLHLVSVFFEARVVEGIESVRHSDLKVELTLTGSFTASTGAVTFLRGGMIFSSQPRTSGAKKCLMSTHTYDATQMNPVL